MKRFAALAVLTALLVSLSACGQWVKDEYLSVGTHQEQPLPTQQTEPADEPVVVGNRNELRGAVLSCIRNWTERSTLTVRGYDGDINADLQETLRYVTAEDPIGAFAVDYADAELSGDAKSGTIELSLVFRRSEKEINAIITVNGSEAAELRVQRALAASETALTLRIRDYQDTDYEQYVRRYCIEHPDQVAAIRRPTRRSIPTRARRAFSSCTSLIRPGATFCAPIRARPTRSSPQRRITSARRARSRSARRGWCGF